MKKINIAEILRDCPQGMELYSPMCGKCTLDNVDDSQYAITVRVEDEHQPPFYFTADGRYLDVVDAECVLFPSKDQRDWSKFQKPFKDGDIIYTKHKLGTEFVSIFQIEYDRDICIYWGINLSTNKLMGSPHEGNSFQIFVEKDKVKEQRLATEEEKQKLFDAIKANGYKWNEETKTLEKLIKLIFKVGNKVRNKNNHNVVFTITSIEEDSYICGAKAAFWIYDQNNYELVPDKFDITTLKPFDKVLVRDNSKSCWDIAFYKRYDKINTFYSHHTLGGRIYRQCIPYEGNEHLAGNVKDCDDYYKTWEK